MPESPSEFIGRPEAANLIGIYAALADQEINEVCYQFGGKKFSTFKQNLVDLAVAKLAPVQEEFCRLIDNTSYLDDIMADGAQRAQAISEPVLKEVHDIVGFFRPKV